MKKFRLLLVLLTAAFAGAMLTSCSPEEIDGFIDGFYDGYYGTSGEAAPATPEVE